MKKWWIKQTFKPNWEKMRSSSDENEQKKIKRYFSRNFINFFSNSASPSSRLLIARISHEANVRVIAFVFCALHDTQFHCIGSHKKTMRFIIFALKCFHSIFCIFLPFEELAIVHLTKLNKITTISAVLFDWLCVFFSDSFFLRKNN